MLMYIYYCKIACHKVIIGLSELIMKYIAGWIGWHQERRRFSMMSRLTWMFAFCKYSSFLEANSIFYCHMLVNKLTHQNYKLYIRGEIQKHSYQFNDWPLNNAVSQNHTYPTRQPLRHERNKISYKTVTTVWPFVHPFCFASFTHATKLHALLEPKNNPSCLTR